MHNSANYSLKVSIIKGHNYPVESHYTRTRDDYILQAFRIPNSASCQRPGTKPVVIFLHGMTASADTFLLNGPKDGLPFMLADACYDVWLANFRGTRYSRLHAYLNPNKNEFWRFSFHEIGVEDLAAFIDYILQLTNEKTVNVVAHSQGCTTLLVLLSMRPEYNEKVKTAILMAPAAFMEHTSTLGQTVFRPYIMLSPDSEYLQHSKFRSHIMPTVCRLGRWSVCNLYLYLNGRPSSHFNTSVYPSLLATHPAGISTRQPKHFIQLTDSGKFRQYDYGSVKNLIVYGQKSPPDYKLYNVRPLSPVHIFYSDDDSSTNATDIRLLGSKLTSVVMNRITKPTWHHLDFIFATTVAKDINMPIIQILDKFS
ncbi:hypothetical protein KR026_011170 [Drosophila bipectinata]|nr:hypothetical protein KR026_011170 [Drosophila bipectinata]